MNKHGSEFINDSFKNYHVNINTGRYIAIEYKQ